MSSNLRRQYELSVYVVAAVVGVAVFAYGVVVVLAPTTGFFAGTTAGLGVLLLSDFAERGYPRTLGRRGTLALVAGVVVFLVLCVLSQRPLRGLALAPLVAVLVWGLTRFREHGYPDSMGRRRSLTTGLVSGGLVTYGSLSGVTGFLVGICAAILVAIASWVTSPRGPVAGRSVGE
ncbi:hypothetical protein GJR96_13035 [Haloferax sp. MBLA0076]|uniref:Uncharacterized protein n=1 Tax=Haloferax litoreum TaxID=2666140 RepID=A0A6A8GK93_9EURY|nr:MULTISPECIES: hypothetical protein [Haloferax]KAB1194311.1 hypothetical protein Hfx1148_12975 [Haloferax sp. CBA1148]MRX22872.1 hypothetical protein [Haloferax litoreum]